MRASWKLVILLLLFVAFSIFVGVFITQQDIPVLQPKGMIAMKQRDLFWTASWLMLIVVIPVLFLTIFFAYKYRASNQKATYRPEWSDSVLAECCWWGIPFIIIVVLAVITWTSSHELNPYKPIVTDKKGVQIQVVALDWKWLFIYPEEKIATVNFIQFPKETPIDFAITADAPMNSFWIPQLGGQIYAMPAMKTELHLMANEEGEFRGSSSNISGTGFAGMVFTAKASSEEAFQDWVASVRQNAPSLDLQEYERLVKPSQYNPVATYTLAQDDLFERIIMQYMR